MASQPTSGTLTFTVAASGDDGDLNSSSPASGGYPPTGSAIPYSTGGVFTTGRRLAFSKYQVLVPLLRFDTSALPDGATITSATLKLRVNAKADGDNRDLQAEWYSASNWPIDAADYTLDSTANALAGADITAITTGTVNSFTLAGLANVNTTGSTGLRLHLSGGQPSADNYVQFAAFDNTKGYPAPQLVIDWTLP